MLDFNEQGDAPERKGPGDAGQMRERVRAALLDNAESVLTHLLPAGARQNERRRLPAGLPGTGILPCSSFGVLHIGTSRCPLDSSRTQYAGTAGEQRQVAAGCGTWAAYMRVIGAERHKRCLPVRSKIKHLRRSNQQREGETQKTHNASRERSRPTR